MDQRERRISWVTGVGIVLLFATVLLAFALAKIKSRTGATGGRELPVYGQVADFTLTNQNGRTISLADLRGHVWVADIIFTRCPGPCRTMTRHMKEIEQALPPDSATKLVSLTTDPDFDSPDVLAKYAEPFQADPNRWLFLTGTKTEIAKLAIDSLKLTAIEKDPAQRDSPQDLWIHSTIFVVVDRKGQLRGVYETVGENVDFQKSKRDILAAVHQLEK